MDRAGYSAPKNVNLTGVVGHFTAEEIEAIKQRALQEGLSSGAVIEGEYQEVMEAKQ